MYSFIKKHTVFSIILALIIITFVVNTYLLLFRYNFKQYGAHFPYRKSEIINSYYTQYDYALPRMNSLSFTTNNLQNAINFYFENNTFIVDNDVVDVVDVDILFQNNNINTFKKTQIYALPVLNAFSGYSYKVLPFNIFNFTTKGITLLKTKTANMLPNTIILIKPKYKTENVYVFFDAYFLCFVPEHFYK